MTNITGRDSYIIMDALATALVALEQLPDERQPKNNMADMRRLLAMPDPASVSAMLAKAKCRLFPNLDPLEVYRSYGIEFNGGGN